MNAIKMLRLVDELVGLDVGAKLRQSKRHCDTAAGYDFINVRKMQICLNAARAADRHGSWMEQNKPNQLRIASQYAWRGDDSN